MISGLRAPLSGGSTDEVAVARAMGRCRSLRSGLIEPHRTFVDPHRRGALTEIVEPAAYDGFDVLEIYRSWDLHDPTAPKSGRRRCQAGETRLEDDRGRNVGRIDLYGIGGCSRHGLASCWVAPASGGSSGLASAAALNPLAGLPRSDPCSRRCPARSVGAQSMR